MRVLALDLSSSTGWACGSDAGTPVSHGVIKMPKTGEDIGRYLRAFRDWLGHAIEDLAPTEIVFEAPILRGENGIAALRKLYSLSGLTELVSLDYGLPVREANLTQIRNHFIGVCRAPADIKSRDRRRQWLKAKVVAKARELGFRVAGDDDADAIALLDYYLSLKAPKHALRSTSLFRERAA